MRNSRWRLSSREAMRANRVFEMLVDGLIVGQKWVSRHVKATGYELFVNLSAACKPHSCPENGT